MKTHSQVECGAIADQTLIKILYGVRSIISASSSTSRSFGMTRNSFGLSFELRKPHNSLTIVLLVRMAPCRNEIQWYLLKLPSTSETGTAAPDKENSTVNPRESNIDFIPSPWEETSFDPNLYDWITTLSEISEMLETSFPHGVGFVFLLGCKALKFGPEVVQVLRATMAYYTFTFMGRMHVPIDVSALIYAAIMVTAGVFIIASGRPPRKKRL